MFESLGPTDASILRHVTDEEYRFFCRLRYLHIHLCHSSDLIHTPWSTIECITRKDRERIDDDNICITRAESRDDIIEVIFCDDRYGLVRNPEAMRSGRYLPYMFFS